MKRIILVAIALSLLSSIAPAGAENRPQTGRPTSTEPAKLNAHAQRSFEINERGVTALQSRNFAQAEALFREALDVDRLNATAAFNLAGMLITNKKEREALPLLKRYADAFPGDASFQARLGDAYFGSEDAKSAIKHYEQALSIDPKYPALTTKLGTLYSLTNELPKATAMFEKALKQNPKDAQALSNLSSLYLADGKPGMAVTTAKRALQIKTSANIYVTLGNAYQDLKDDRNALASFQRAQQLGYSDPKLAKLIEQLESSIERAS